MNDPRPLIARLVDAAGEDEAALYASMVPRQTLIEAAEALEDLTSANRRLSGIATALRQEVELYRRGMTVEQPRRP